MGGEKRGRGGGERYLCDALAGHVGGVFLMYAVFREKRTMRAVRGGGR